MKTIKLEDFDNNRTIKTYVKESLQKLIFASIVFIIIITIAFFHRDSQANLIAGISIFSLLFFIFIFGIYSDIKGLAWYCKGLEDKQNIKDKEK
ncbi:hypothetical protein DMB95_08935 [Campylobacter sp. MIT 12-8780]|uniref:hypothetical protein n=1 Tax=unclassified Campylobacter TaxID=2593542 RepID=UPI00115DC8BD|nr:MULTISPECIES: hypothetical protein [unclassified Campylobacter]NDJ27923.1 hypothetical protein [Campylobacter sp. MIT 19-121]TQR40144.1 hypothetical protein DMB95_08935 [Campylobacter sp. MIT 12-8780]